MTGPSLSAARAALARLNAAPYTPRVARLRAALIRWLATHPSQKGA